MDSGGEERVYEISRVTDPDLLLLPIAHPAADSGVVWRSQELVRHQLGVLDQFPEQRDFSRSLHENLRIGEPPGGIFQSGRIRHYAQRMRDDSLTLNELWDRDIPEPAVLEGETAYGGQVLLTENIPVAGQRLRFFPAHNVIPDRDIPIIGQKRTFSGDRCISGPSR